MGDLRQETIDTYNRSAEGLAAFFRGVGPRTEDIERAFELAGNPENAKVVEVGCGDGRDAAEIVKRAPDYTGFDLSEALISIARRQVPEGDFEVADAVDYTFPANLDIVFAFGSLLHLTKPEIRRVCTHIYPSLSSKGILYLALKYAPEYSPHLLHDDYGTRMFYLYNKEVIEQLAGEQWQTAYHERYTINTTEWFRMALRKRRNG